MHTVLLLGGKPIGSVEIAKYVKSLGDRLIVADYLPVAESPAKQFADQAWDVSTADVDALVDMANSAGVDAVMAGVHEFNIERAIEVAGKLNLPFWCTAEQWSTFEDKPSFKRKCREFGIAVALEYDDGDVDSIDFPVVVKPADGSGSRGFSVCCDYREYTTALNKARDFSPTGSVLIEEFVQGEAVIIHYTIHDGEVIFSGIADKHSEQMGSGGAPVMALQLAPSLHEAQYLSEVDGKAKAMIGSLGIREAPLWIEAFYRDGTFVFNEAGLRFGGSMTNLMVESVSGIDQMSVLYAACVGEAAVECEPLRERRSVYAIFPMQLRPGIISAIEGMSELEQDNRYVAATMVHRVGDEVGEWGSAQQVFSYLHFKAISVDDLIDVMRKATRCLSVKDENGREMLFSLFDPFNEDNYPSFLAVQAKR